MKKYLEFGEKLKQYRERSGESITASGISLNVDRSHLSKLENGHERPSIELFNLLVRHYSLSEAEATDLSLLAGFRGQDLVVLKEKEVNMTQNATSEQPEKPTLQVRVPDNSLVLYTDSVWVTTSPYGLVLDFAQNFGPTNQQTVVSRIGMSKDHAKSMLKLLQERIEKMDEGQK